MAGPLANSAGQFSGPPYMHPFRPASSMSANRFDEGYSEDTRSQTDSDLVMRSDSRLVEDGMQPDSPFSLPDWVMALNEGERSGKFIKLLQCCLAYVVPEFAYAILRSLRTSSIADIVEKLNPLLHLDPVTHLPPEITFQILSYLDPETLLRSSTLSRAWRTRVLDSPLWKLLFRLEGWNSNFQQVRAYEDAEKLRRIGSKAKERRTRPRAAEDMDYDKPSSKKRVRERQLFGDGPSDNSIHNNMEPLSIGGAANGNSSWGEQHGLVEADDSPLTNAGDQMEGLSFDNESPTQSTAETVRDRRLDVLGASSGSQFDLSGICLDQNLGSIGSTCISRNADLKTTGTRDDSQISSCHIPITQTRLTQSVYIRFSTLVNISSVEVGTGLSEYGISTLNA
jgi:F-box and WD-40 domain protein 1/11